MIDVYVTGEILDHNFTISMPRKDKERLEFFFRHYCLFEQWVYTLAGVKPVTFSACHKTFPIGWVPLLKNRQILGWETWLKYQHYFQDSRFVMFQDKSLISDDWIFVVIADRLQFDLLIQKYANDFQSVLHLDHLDAGRLLEAAKNRSFFTDILKSHDGLIGTVLGYGRDNAWQFFERSQGKQIILEPIWDEALMEQILEAWNKKPFYEFWSLSHLFYPSFMANKGSEESIAFRNLYQETRKQIVQYYEGKDFVEATLTLLNYR
jgi:hypothetical protein